MQGLRQTGEPFDLITFPEAFLPANRLVAALEAFVALPSLGCVHVGLRPSTEPNHLFTVAELQSLVETLKAVANIEVSDFNEFAAWLENQTANKRFNVGCLFTIDSNQRLRICLHPKLQRSKFEFGMLEEDVMDEARLITIVTLKPTDKRLQSLTIQPLLCSDALLLNTDIPGSRPLEAVHLEAESFSDVPPDHIDVVSVAALTPQNENKSGRYRTWKQSFRDSFERATTDPSLSRHRFAAFILSNFGQDLAQGPAGLSGAYVPLKPSREKYPEFVSIACWGWPKNDHDLKWSTPIEDCAGWTNLGHIASLNTFSAGSDAGARMFGFTFAALPRDTSRWQPQPPIGGYKVRIGDYAVDKSSFVFE